MSNTNIIHIEEIHLNKLGKEIYIFYLEDNFSITLYMYAKHTRTSKRKKFKHDQLWDKRFTKMGNIDRTQINIPEKIRTKALNTARNALKIID
jgi:hypothetical protein|tara:strand:+ start:617 stop:895 length:279 start_codon:yes stop_codon:yes gene_type:complete